MAKEFNVAVAGATGAVGVEMIKTLEKRNFPVKNLKLLASSRSAGKTLEYKDLLEVSHEDHPQKESLRAGPGDNRICPDVDGHPWRLRVFL